MRFQYNIPKRPGNFFPRRDIVTDIANAWWIRWFAGESLVQEEEEKVRFGVCPVRHAIPLWEAPLAALARLFRLPAITASE